MEHVLLIVALIAFLGSLISITILSSLTMNYIVLFLMLLLVLVFFGIYFFKKDLFDVYLIYLFDIVIVLAFFLVFASYLVAINSSFITTIYQQNVLLNLSLTLFIISFISLFLCVRYQLFIKVDNHHKEWLNNFFGTLKTKSNIIQENTSPDVELTTGFIDALNE